MAGLERELVTKNEKNIYNYQVVYIFLSFEINIYVQHHARARFQSINIVII